MHVRVPHPAFRLVQEDILSIAYSSEGGGNLLATSGYDGRVLVWNMDSGVVKFTLTIAGVAAMEVPPPHNLQPLAPSDTPYR